MVDYVFIKKNEAQAFEAAHPRILDDRATHVGFECCQNARDDDLLAIAAIDKGRVVGRMFFTYGYLSNGREKLRVTVAQDLYVTEKRQGSGIGVKLIKHSLKVKLPCIYSGISAAAMPIYKKLGFSFVDESPVFQLPLNWPAVIKVARASLYDEENKDSSNTISAILTTVKTRKHLIGSTTRFVSLPEPQALEAFPELLSQQTKRFQIPWDEGKICDGIRGRADAYLAFVFTSSGNPSAQAYLVSIYTREAKVRMPVTGEIVTIKDGHVNEIYPPIQDSEEAKALIIAVAKQAKGLGYGNISVYALTKALAQACKELGAYSRHCKSFAIQPLGLSGELAEAICRPEEWWCRTMNEDQIEEARGPY